MWSAKRRPRPAAEVCGLPHAEMRRCYGCGTSSEEKARQTQAVRTMQFGGPVVLQMVEAAKPEPVPDGIAVRVRGAGVNRHDPLLHLGDRVPAA